VRWEATVVESSDDEEASAAFEDGVRAVRTVAPPGGPLVTQTTQAKPAAACPAEDVILTPAEVRAMTEWIRFRPPF